MLKLWKDSETYILWVVGETVFHEPAYRLVNMADSWSNQKLYYKPNLARS